MGPPGAGLAALGDDLPACRTVPRHPSQIYQALLEGLLLFIVMCALSRRGGSARALRPADRSFLVGYAVARIIGEFFREPDAFLGFLLRRPDDGAGAVGADAPGRHLADRARLAGPASPA